MRFALPFFSSLFFFPGLEFSTKLERVPRTRWTGENETRPFARVTFGERRLMEAGRKITRRKKKKKRWMNATYAVPVSRCNVSREIKSSPIWNKNRQREKEWRKEKILSLSAFLIRINRCPKESGLINRYAKVCNIILVEWTFETARFILPPPRFLSQPRRGGALFGLSKQEAKGGLRGR